MRPTVALVTIIYNINIYRTHTYINIYVHKYDPINNTSTAALVAYNNNNNNNNNNIMMLY
jgi:hypothetical protein